LDISFSTFVFVLKIFDENTSDRVVRRQL